MNELERQMQALGMQKPEMNQDKIYRHMLAIAKRTRKPVKMQELIRVTGLTRSQTQSAVQRLLNSGRALQIQPGSKLGLYVPKVV